jgi:hypothetical protein
MLNKQVDIAIISEIISIKEWCLDDNVILPILKKRLKKYLKGQVFVYSKIEYLILDVYNFLFIYNLGFVINLVFQLVHDYFIYDYFPYLYEDINNILRDELFYKDYFEKKSNYILKRVNHKRSSFQSLYKKFNKIGNVGSVLLNLWITNKLNIKTLKKTKTAFYSLIKEKHSDLLNIKLIDTNKHRLPYSFIDSEIYFAKSERKAKQVLDIYISITRSNI